MTSKSFCYLSCFAIFLTLYFSFNTPCVWGQHEDHWGPQEATPAVVNPVVRYDASKILSLRGPWEIVPDSTLLGRHRMGKGPDWNEPDWSGVRTINVPSCWEAEGLGEPGTGLHWDPVFDCNPRPLKHIYMGVVRYRKTITLPADWSGQQIWLAIGGVKSEGYFWVNKKRVCYVNNYCGTYKYNITDYVVAGEPVEIVATVRNDTPSRKGLFSGCHRWGGLYRDVELQATNETWLDDVHVRGDYLSRTAEIHAAVASVLKETSSLTAQVTLKTLDGRSLVTTAATPVETGQDNRIQVPCPDLKLWTPEEPNLYLADVVLRDESGKIIDGWTERFGLRKLEVVGKEFHLNGKPYLLRGYGDDFVYPLTLASPADYKVHLENMKVIKRAGFNYVRLHTHNEIPEFYEAADEAGILVQPELPYYHDITTEGFIFDPMRDLQELWRHFRRYVSFATYSTGNEGYLGKEIGDAMYQWVKANDPDRIMQHQDGGCNTPTNSDFDSPNSYHGPSSIMPWMAGTFDYLDRPFIAHEYLNLGIKMDPRLEDRFTGIMNSPRTMKAYEELLSRCGLARVWGDRCLAAAHGLQGYYQKDGIERARLDPACDGYSYWTLVDVMVNQGPTYTGQGFLNAFYEQKEGGLSPEEFAAFNSPTAILATGDPGLGVLASGMTESYRFYLSHFGADPIPAGKLVWSIVNRDGKTMLSGEIAHGEIATGFVGELGDCAVTVPKLDRPEKVDLVVKLEGTSIENRWPKYWFPERKKQDGTGLIVSESLWNVLSDRYEGLVKYDETRLTPNDILIASAGEACVKAALAKGCRVLALGEATGGPNVRLGWWSLGSQLGTAFEQHAAFGDFPHTGRIDTLWFRLVCSGMFDLSVSNPLGQLEPLAVGEGLNTYYLYMGEGKSDNGYVLATYGLALLEDYPEAVWLLDNLVQYVKTRPAK
ncbi:MAG: glycoside hydrolase family 2 TIM barrel-domain containing protein [Planctomycetia bacterium]|nr:glycoside hydrolase family 2 TIM barrel-domain containing protein [Planctomycetia bacterium]